MNDIQYIQEASPDYNFFIENGNLDKLAANRVVLSIFTEFGLMNNRKMRLNEYNNFISNIQIVTSNDNSGIVD